MQTSSHVSRNITPLDPAFKVASEAVGAFLGVYVPTATLWNNIDSFTQGDILTEWQNSLKSSFEYYGANALNIADGTSTHILSDLMNRGFDFIQAGFHPDNEPFRMQISGIIFGQIHSAVSMNR